ncbi:MAG: hypothetical protein AAGK00_05625 [Pseudomonadota bacterium]
MSHAVELPETTDMEPQAGFLSVVETALVILEEERRLFLTGAYSTIPDVVSRKQVVLEALDAWIPLISPDDQIVDAMRRLIASSRRNEQLIQAARAGLSHAKRKIATIRAAERGDVAYAEDGSRIASRADLIGNGKSA